MERTRSTLSRRSFVAGVSGALAAPMVLRVSRAATNSESITYVTWGGSWLDAQLDTVIKLFTDETGVKVNVDPAPDLAKVKAQQLTGNVVWDVIDLPGSMAASGAKQGFWQKLDSSMFDVADLAVAPTGENVAMGLYVGGVTWDPKKYASGGHPSNFAEYFDLKKFPGRRTLRNRPMEPLEAALLADGVLPKDIYPLDVDRAFKVLDRIKPSIASWTTSVAQTISLVQTGEVDFSYSYTNRVKPTTEPGGGVPLAFSFEQNLIGTEALSVLKGAPNKEGAMKFIAFYLRPDVQARTLAKSGGVPNSKKAASMLPAEVRKWQPDWSNSNNLVINDAYWADHEEAVSRRFKEWVLS